jgi:hypothetical protein
MDTSSLSFRKEILDYLRCLQRLLASRNEPETSRFSEDELEVLEYAMAELQKVCVRDKQNALEP